MNCDLHIHSTASDGTDAPETLPALAVEAGLAAIALTDHDTTVGVLDCAKACEQAGIAFVPGIELSADARSLRTLAKAVSDRKRSTLHVLGYFIDPTSTSLTSLFDRLHNAREVRNKKVIEKLQALGVHVTYDELLALVAKEGADAIGRPHLAQLLVERGYVRTLHEAFTQYLGKGASAYAHKDRLTAEDAIAAIHGAGGMAFLAHPTQLHAEDEDQLEHAIKCLCELGLDGIEVQHSDHSARETLLYRKMAQSFKLLVSGGSDYHGERKRVALNASRVSYAVYEALAEAHASRTSFTSPSSP